MRLQPVLMALVLGFGLCGCEVEENESPQATSLEANVPSDTPQPAYSLADGIKVKVFTSKQYSFQSKESETKPAFESFINSGRYSIVNTKTVYDSGFLIAAEVYYKEKPTPP